VCYTYNIDSRDAPKYLVEWEINMNRNKLDSLMCVWCLGWVADEIDYSNGTQYCVPCHDYKGVSTVREYLEIYEGLVFA
jgi:hypothetical protein